MNLLLPLYMAATAGGVDPILSLGNRTYTSGGSGQACGVRFNTDGTLDELDNVSYIASGDYLIPARPRGDYSVYFLTVGMDGGDTEGTWLELNTSREWWIDSAGLTRNTTIYMSYGIRSGTTLGAWDTSGTFQFNVPS